MRSIQRHISATMLVCLMGGSLNCLFAGEAADSEKIPDLRPPAELLSPTFWDQYSWWVIGLAAFSLVALLLLIHWLRQPFIIPEPGPAVAARRDLEALAVEPEHFATVSAVNYVLRRYLAAVYGLRSEELTTEEYRQALRETPKLAPDLSNQILEFFSECDATKFSPASQSGSIEAAARAAQIIEAIEAHRHPGPAVDGGHPKSTPPSSSTA